MMKNAICYLIFLFFFNLTAPDVLAQKIVPITIHQAPQMILDLDSIYNTCVGAKIVLGGSPTASGGTGTLYYSWVPVTGLDDPTKANPELTVTSSAFYSVFVFDAAGCLQQGYTNINASFCTGVDLVEQSREYVLFPNPVENRFYIKTSGASSPESVAIEIMSVIGVRVDQQAVNINHMNDLMEVDVSYLEAGLYLVIIRDAHGSTSHRIQIK